MRTSTEETGESALARARQHLLGRQHPAGWWKGERVGNVTSDAEDLLLRQFLGVRTAGQTAAAARWIRSQQRDDGSWATFYGGPGELSTTIEAYLALRLAGDGADAPHLVRAAGFVRGHGGVEASRVLTRIWLALFGLWSWQDVPAMPPEQLLPDRAPLSIYDVASWARRTTVALTIIRAYRPVRDMGVTVDELRAGTRTGRAAKRPQRVAARRPRERALQVAEEWLLVRQEADGSWSGQQPPWALIALHLRGYPVHHPVIQAGLERFAVYQDASEGPIRRLEACQSPVWDTALAITALAEAGVSRDDPALTGAGRWLLGQEVHGRGDWRVRRPRIAAGGWPLEFHNRHYPSIDGTAQVLGALQRTGVATDPARRRGAMWLRGMQGNDGGWAAFDADQPGRMAVEVPFYAPGEVSDYPTADVTAHAVEALCREGLAETGAVRDGVAWLLTHQHPDGSWDARWGVRRVYAVGAVVPALIAAGIGPGHPAIRRAVEWLLANQHRDGGWGEDPRAGDDPAWAGRGTPTASQTGWALLALQAAGYGGHAAIARAVRWLCATQCDDGTWDEPQYTASGMGGDFHLNDGLYRLVSPVRALARWVRRASTAYPPDVRR